MTAAELLDVAEVERLTVRPGDFLVVKTPHYLGDEEVQRIHDRMKEVFPDTDILIFEGGADLAVLRAEDAPSTSSASQDGECLNCEGAGTEAVTP